MTNLQRAAKRRSERGTYGICIVHESKTIHCANGASIEEIRANNAGMNWEIDTPARRRNAMDLVGRQGYKWASQAEQEFTQKDFDNYLESVGIEDTYVQDAVRMKYGSNLRTMAQVVNECKKWNDPVRAKESLLKNASC